MTVTSARACVSCLGTTRCSRCVKKSSTCLQHAPQGAALMHDDCTNVSLMQGA